MSMPEETHDSGLNLQYQTYKHQKCFVGHSHKASWSADIVSACEAVLPKFDLDPWYADDYPDPTKTLRDKVVEMIANARYGIYDLSYWRNDEKSEWIMPRNVLIELGMAIALNRPALLLRHAENQASGLGLPRPLESMSEQILEFSGEATLKQVLEKRLPQWVNRPPERDWWNRYCLFGDRVCEYREAYPHAKQWGQEILHCHVSDGPDIDAPDFRSVVKEELGRYNDLTFHYLNELPLANGYEFLLCAHCQLVRSTPFAIYRITPKTLSETFIAIGMSIALEKLFDYEIPKILLTANAQDVPSLLSGYGVGEAQNDKERKALLRKFIPVVIQKVRETSWKPRPLPFVEVIPQQVEKAIIDDGRVIQPESNDAYAFKHKGDSLRALKQYEEALAAYEQAILLDPDVAIFHSNKGIVLDDLERYTEAIVAFEHAIELDPVNTNFYNNRGNVYYSLKMYQEAIVDYDRAIALDTSNASAYNYRGQVYFSLKDYQCAIEDFDRALELDPSYAEAHNRRTRAFSFLKTLSNQLLRRERERRGWSQEYVANRIGAPSANIIGRWERGNQFPTPLYRQRLCELFGKSAEELGLIREDAAIQEDFSRAEIIAQPGMVLAISRPGNQPQYLQLSQLEYQLFKTLLQHPNRCSEEELMIGAWGRIVERATFTQRMYSLRKKLRDQCEGVEIIENSYGGFYSLNQSEWFHLGIDAEKPSLMREDTENSETSIQSGSVPLQIGSNVEQLQMPGFAYLEGKVYEYLKSHTGEVCDREEIKQAVWENNPPTNSALQKIIQRIREKIEPDPENPRHLIAVRGQGYVLREDISKISEELPVPPIASFPERLKAYRMAIGLTQEELAERLHYSTQTISAWERGKRYPMRQDTPMIARQLGITQEELVQSINATRESRTIRP